MLTLAVNKLNYTWAVHSHIVPWGESGVYWWATYPVSITGQKATLWNCFRFRKWYGGGKAQAPFTKCYHSNTEWSSICQGIKFQHWPHTKAHLVSRTHRQCIMSLLFQQAWIITTRDVHSDPTVPKNIWKNALPVFWGYILAFQRYLVFFGKLKKIL